MEGSVLVNFDVFIYTETDGPCTQGGSSSAFTVFFNCGVIYDCAIRLHKHNSIFKLN